MVLSLTILNSDCSQNAVFPDPNSDHTTYLKLDCTTDHYRNAIEKFEEIKTNGDCYCHDMDDKLGADKRKDCLTTKKPVPTKPVTYDESQLATQELPKEDDSWFEQCKFDFILGHLSSNQVKPLIPYFNEVYELRPCYHILASRKNN